MKNYSTLVIAALYLTFANSFDCLAFESEGAQSGGDRKRMTESGLSENSKNKSLRSDIEKNPMNQSIMESLVKAMASRSKGEKGVIDFTYNEIQMYLISDVSHNRMRIIAPIADYKSLKRHHVDAAMQSNFHDALDARYAVSDGVLFSVFIHSLSELTENQIRSAVIQVANLALSFGRDYTSGVLTYGEQQTL